MRQDLSAEEAGEKFGISLPKNALDALENLARKMGKTRSSLIREIVVDAMRRTADAEGSTVHGRRIDENACVRRLIADSEGLGFDMENDCAKRAVARGLTGEEWDPRLFPTRLELIIQRQKQNDDYWGVDEDRRYNRLNSFADMVGIDRASIIRIAREVEYVK